MPAERSLSMIIRRTMSVASLLALLISSSPAASAEEAQQRPVVGQEANDFTLTTPGGKPVKLSELTKQGPVVVLVLRGYPGYQCPICTAQVGDYLGKAKQFEQKNATLVFIYPGPAEGLKEHAEEFVRGKTLPANAYLLTDPDYSFTESYGLRWDEPRETAFPSTFLINGERKVLFAKVSMTHSGRTKAAEVLKLLDRQ